MLQEIQNSWYFLYLGELKLPLYGESYRL
jgi:hypothetical protein